MPGCSSPASPASMICCSPVSDVCHRRNMAKSMHKDLSPAYLGDTRKSTNIWHTYICMRVRGPPQHNRVSLPRHSRWPVLRHDPAPGRMVWVGHPHHVQDECHDTNCRGCRRGNLQEAEAGGVKTAAWKLPWCRQLSLCRTAAISCSEGKLIARLANKGQASFKRDYENSAHNQREISRKGGACTTQQLCAMCGTSCSALVLEHSGCPAAQHLGRLPACNLRVTKSTCCALLST